MKRQPPLCVVILAAGQGTRMKSAIAKVLHPLAGRPLIGHTLAAAAALDPQRIVLVVGKQSDEVRKTVADEAARLGLDARRIAFALQRRQLGTGHALLQAEKAIGSSRGNLLILSGDVPTVRPETLRRMLRRHRAAGAAVTVMTTNLMDPSGYGRIEREARGSSIERIIEHVDASAQQRRITEINCGIYVADRRLAFDAVRGGKRSNRQREYYLTDLVEAVRRQGGKVLADLQENPEEVMGVNDRLDLARAGALLRRRVLERLMRSGVTVIDPDRTYVDVTVAVGKDTVLYPGTVLQGETRVGAGSVIHSGTRIRDSVLGSDCEILDHCLVQESKLGKAVRVGPMAHLRPGTELADEVRIGNFVETKKTTMGRGAKANHLTYLGDASIGPRVNIGAGTITCNYDGEKKHRTEIGAGVFIGSDSQLVAPVKVGKGAYIAAGSTITRDVPEDALGIARVQQDNKKGWAKKRRASRAQSARKKKG